MPTPAGPTTATPPAALTAESPLYAAPHPATVSALDVQPPLDVPAENQTCRPRSPHTPLWQSVALPPVDPRPKTIHPCRNSNGPPHSRGTPDSPTHASR